MRLARKLTFITVSVVITWLLLTLSLSMAIRLYTILFEPLAIDTTEVTPVKQYPVSIDICKLAASGAVVATTDTNCKEY